MTNIENFLKLIDTNAVSGWKLKAEQKQQQENMNPTPNLTEKVIYLTRKMRANNVNKSDLMREFSQEFVSYMKDADKIIEYLDATYTDTNFNAPTP